jgi:8-oxo-dGTP pyrophosphatase MutT (NUDIX family)
MLPTHAELLKLINAYETQFPQELNASQTFQEFVKRNSNTSVYSRKNFDGHFTASAFLLDVVRDKVLFLQHKKLKRWLQPGGHIDETDASLLAAAVREVCEETGFQSINLQLVEENIFDLDAHEIPLNPKKDEPAHIHFDIRYLFQVNNGAEIVFNAEEASGMKWLTFDEVGKLEGFDRIIQKLKKLP